MNSTFKSNTVSQTTSIFEWLRVPDYAAVHCIWTIPLAITLWLSFRRIRTKREIIKTNALICIAVIATIPWDNYLIETGIWTYPEKVIYGPKLLSIPLEELFFFFIQTYITSSLYAVISKKTVHAVLLSKNDSDGRFARWIGTTLLFATTIISALVIKEGGQGLYLALILVWVSPFLVLLWFLTSDHIIAMKKTAFITIMIPTVYLWVLDSIALQRGTWVIEHGTKLNISYQGLEIEEAIFFFLTNVLIVFGLIACDKSLAIHDVYHEHYPLRPSQFPSAISVIRSMTTPPSAYASNRLQDLQIALNLLRDKSKSFYTASMVFEGKLKLDLLSLYSFCRVADDLVDEAESPEAAEKSLNMISSFLDLIFPPGISNKAPTKPSTATAEKIELLLAPLPESTRSAFKLLASLPIPRKPLDELVAGFKTDLLFHSIPPSLPIVTQADLILYSSNVASSVAELCVRLVWMNEEFDSEATTDRSGIIDAAREMGVALQLVNIARDVSADKLIGRMYLPGFALDAKTEALTAERFRLLSLAKTLAARSKDKIELLPRAGRNGIRAACAVYLEIGRAVKDDLDAGKTETRAKVDKLSRFRTAWSALA